MSRLPTPFQLGEYVYHVAEEGPAGIVIGINFSLGGGVAYNIQWDRLGQNTHYAPELRREPTFGDPGKLQTPIANNTNTKTQ